MHWIMTYFDHRNTNKLFTTSKHFFIGFSFFWEKMGINVPLLGQNGYKCCLNTSDQSLTLIISQIHWIVTYFDHRNTNKLFTTSKQIFIGFSFFWEKMGIKVV
ncbi:hypothetical protein AtNW77_Chr1g0041911 [Arabidopsis thaliana]